MSSDCHLISVCGGHLQAQDYKRHLYSHARYGHDNYGKSMDCDWTIEAEPGKNVHLTFLTFDIESNKDCEYDYVEVYSGLDSSVSQASYGRFCGTTVSNRQPGRASPVDVD